MPDFDSVHSFYSMKLRSLIRVSLTAALVLAAGSLAGPVPADASTQGVCYGAVGCAGQDPAASGCTGSEQLVQDQAVPQLGDIDLYHSSVCGTFWATLFITGNYNEPATGPWPELAEIFYVPPLGGPEQFDTAQWDLTIGHTTTTLMVPDSGSIKACGGDPGDNTHAFDVDPQGGNGLAVGNEFSYYGTGACTLWH